MMYVMEWMRNEKLEYLSVRLFKVSKVVQATNSGLMMIQRMIMRMSVYRANNIDRPTTSNNRGYVDQPIGFRVIVY